MSESIGASFISLSAYKNFLPHGQSDRTNDIEIEALLQGPDILPGCRRDSHKTQNNISVWCVRHFYILDCDLDAPCPLFLPDPTNIFSR